MKKFIKQIEKVGTVLYFKNFGIEELSDIAFLIKRQNPDVEKRPQFLIYSSIQDYKEAFKPMLKALNCYYGVVGSNLKLKKTSLVYLAETSMYMDGITFHLFVKWDLQQTVVLPFTDKESQPEKSFLLNIGK